MIIRSATNLDQNTLRDLWHDCFGDEYEYIDFFFKNRFSGKLCAVLEDLGEIFGMIHLIPCTIYPNEKAFYWYAAGIRSDRRNEGLFKKFAAEVKEKVNLAGFKNVCVPAQGLEKIYQNLGFRTEYLAKDIIYRKNENNLLPNTFEIFEAKGADFLQIKKNRGDLCWGEDAIEYAIAENNFCDGKALKVCIDQRTYSFFAIQKKQSEYLIENHNFSISGFDKIKDHLFDYLKADTLILRCEGGEKIVGLSDSSCISKKARISMNLA